MEQQTAQTRVVNSLPVKTWHRLKVNDGQADWYIPTAPCAVQVGSEQGQAAISAIEKQEEPVGEIATGVGTTLTSLMTWNMTVTMAEQSEDIVRMIIGETPNTDTALQIQVQAEAGSHLTLVQQWDAHAAHAAVQTVLKIGVGASVHLVQIVAEDSEEVLNDVGCTIAEHGAIQITRLYLSKGNVISGIRADLMGDHSQFTSHTGYLVPEAKKLDMNIIVNHIGKQTISNIIAEGTVQNHAEKIFRGTIDLRNGCSGSEGTETETVLLLGDDVVNKTVPLILCSEEDVKGSHGASIGELPSEILFYFAARGIPKEIAEKIVSKAKLETLCQETDKTTAEILQKTIEEAIAT